MQQVQGLFLSQRQVQALSQRQLQSLSLLSLGTDDVRKEVYKAIEENPALELVSDKRESGIDIKRSGPADFTRLSSSVSGESAVVSDRFQAVLEAQEDKRQSLSEHLLTQLHVLPLSKTEESICERLIYNLDQKGFHILAPVSLLNKENADETQAVLQKCLDIVQHLDPLGVCTQNVEESLLVQAKEKNASPLVLFLLSGHLDFISPPQPSRAQKKITAFFAEREKLFGVTDAVSVADFDLSETGIQEAIDCIRSLDPFPARNFGTSEAQYVLPDVTVSLVPEDADVREETMLPVSSDKTLVYTPDGTWAVELFKGALPAVAINEEFAAFSRPDAKEEDTKMVMESVKKARDFLDFLLLRQHSIMRAVCHIVLVQHQFFKKGPGFLVALKQKELAAALDLHESTISRLVNGKYVRCAWGLFELKYFFSNAVQGAPAEKAAGGTNQQEAGTQSGASKDAVLKEIKHILEESAQSGKKLSDQKIADQLLARGIHISRRTVAKYREQLHIASSYNR